MADHSGEVRLAYSIDEEGVVQAELRGEDSWSPLPNFSIPARESLLGQSGQILGLETAVSQVVATNNANAHLSVEEIILQH